MNILMISDVYFPRINGVSTSIATFRRELQALGHRIDLIVPAYPQDHDDDEGITRVPSRYLLIDPEDRIMRCGAVLAQEGFLRRQAYDIVHIQTPFLAHGLGVKLAKRLNLPCIESYHTFFEEYLFHYLPFMPRSLMRALARRFSRHQCNQVDGIITPSSAMLEVLRDYGVTVEGAIIATGIQSGEFAQGDGQAFREKLGIAPGRFVLTHVGRIAHEKNIDFLLRALQGIQKHMPDIALIIAGDGPALAHIKKLARKLGLHDNVFYAGYLDRQNELPACYHAGDAFVFASRTETQGLVLLESLAAGVPVVSTAVMGTRDIVLPKRGCVPAQENEADFALKTIELLHDETRRHRLGKEARVFAREWDARAQAQRLLSFYQQIIATKTEGHAQETPREAKMR